jgi:hypothetical protein
MGIMRGMTAGVLEGDGAAGRSGPGRHATVVTMDVRDWISAGLALAALGLGEWAPPAHAGKVFCDRFRPAANAAWGDERGAWRAGAAQYDASMPNNNPPTYTDLTTYQNLGNFTVWVTVNDLNDGGVWLRSGWNGGAINGVLLVTGGDIGTNNGFYWHVVQNGVFSSPMSPVSVPGIQGSKVPLKIVVKGSTYKLYIDGAKTPISTLVDPTFSVGSVGLYDFSPTSGASSPRGQTFSDFCLATK